MLPTDEEMVATLNKVVSDELIKRVADPIEVVITKTIKAKYATMPVTDLSIKVLIEQLEPVQMVAEVITVGIGYAASLDGTTEARIKKRLLDIWHKQLLDLTPEERAKVPQWMLEVDSVELIECNLLVPK